MTTLPAVYLTFPEACEYARINRNKMRDLLKAGKIPFRKFAGKRVIAKAAIDRRKEYKEFPR